MAFGFGSVDLLTTLVIAAPGFLTLLLFARYSVENLGLETWEKVMLSLVFSAIIGGVFLFCNRLTSEEGLSTFFLHHPLRSLFHVLFLSVVLAGVMLYFSTRDPVSRFVRSRLFGHYVLKPSTAETWDRFMDRNELKPVLVTCTDESLYTGILAGYSTGDEDRALTLEHPVEVVYDNEGEPIEGEETVELLLESDDILRVEVTEDKPRDLREDDEDEARSWGLMLAAGVSAVLFLVDCAGLLPRGPLGF